jgi:hypothetical protein
MASVVSDGDAHHRPEKGKGRQHDSKSDKRNEYDQEQGPHLAAISFRAF